VNMGHTLKALSGISGQSDYAGGATGGAYRPPGDAPVRDPRRLALAYQTGKMTPEDAALYEQGLKVGAFGTPQEQEQPRGSSALEVYAATALQRPQWEYQLAGMPQNWQGM